MPPQRGYLYFVDEEGHLTKAKLKRDETVQDCPKGYVHHAGEICMKCGRRGEPVAKVKQNPEKPVAPEILAEAIVRLANGMQKLNASGLNKDAIIVLLHDDTKIAKRDVERILHSLESLARRYTR